MEARVGVGVLGIAVSTAVLLLFGPAAQGLGLETSTCEPVTIDAFAAPDKGAKASKKSNKTETDCTPFVYDMGHPLAIPGRVISDFGDEREGGRRLHLGTDVAAPILTPVLSVAEGVVATIHNQAGTDDCCWVSVDHDDGWASLYIHLNNDLFGTDDGTTSGVRRDLSEGDRVAAGEILGWVGDSGNAEDTVSHLHFGLLNRAGIPIDAGPSLAASSSRTAFLLPDDEGHPYRSGTVALSSLGLLWACDETGLMTCPNEPARVDDLTKLAVELLGIDVEGIETTYGIQALHGDETPHQFLVEKLMNCPEDECRPRGVTRGELARLTAIMSRFLISDQGVFGPDSKGVSRLPGRNEAIDFLTFTGGLQTCELPLDTGRLLTRGEAVYLLVDWLGVIAVDSCPETALPIR